MRSAMASPAFAEDNPGTQLTLGDLHLRGAAPRPSQENHVQVVRFDQAIQMEIDERQARACTPMAQEAILDMLWL